MVKKKKSKLNNLNWILCMLDFHCWIAQVNCRDLTRCTNILDANLLLKHINDIITLDIDWNWTIFFVQMLCSMLIKQVTDLRKVRTENLLFRTDLKVRCQWLLISIVESKWIMIFWGRFKFFKLAGPGQVNSGLYMPMWHRFVLCATVLAATFGCIQFKKMPQIVP